MKLDDITPELQKQCRVDSTTLMPTKHEAREFGSFKKNCRIIKLLHCHVYHIQNLSFRQHVLRKHDGYTHIILSDRERESQIEEVEMF